MGRIDELTVKAGANVLIGAPANPIAGDARAAIGAAVARLNGVREAHLPQVFLPGVTEGPAQVLVLVLARSASVEMIMGTLGPQPHAIVPKGMYLDVWPLPRDHELLPAIRGAGCQLYAEPARPW
jgi:hypothetical protein